MSKWRWRMQGESIARTWPTSFHDDTGVVEAECVGEVVEWMARYGWWDGINQNEEVIITITPTDDDDAVPDNYDEAPSAQPDAFTELLATAKRVDTVVF